MDADFGSKLVENTLRDFIRPEIDRRRAEGTMSSGFSWNKALVRFPSDSKPMVSFNGEFGLEARVATRENPNWAEGQSVTLFDLERVKAVAPISFDGVPVAFLYMEYRGPGWNVIFDFSPNHPGYTPPESPDEWSHSRLFAEILNKQLVLQSFEYVETHRAVVDRLGLWPIPSLMPNPLARAIKAAAEGSEADALKQVFDHCTDEFLQERWGGWTSLDVVKARWSVVQPALDTFLAGNYSLAIYALVPQIEGIVSDWIESRASDGQVPFRDRSKFKYVKGSGKEHGLQGEKANIAFRLLDHILDGPLMKTFAKWGDAANPRYLNRHRIAHGSFDPVMFSRENAVRAVLLLDSVTTVLSWYRAPGSC